MLEINFFVLGIFTGFEGFEQECGLRFKVLSSCLAV